MYHFPAEPHVDHTIQLTPFRHPVPPGHPATLPFFHRSRSQELYGIGQRFRDRHAAWLNGHSYNIGKFDFESTQQARASQSGSAFALGLWEGTGNLGPRKLQSVSITSESKALDTKLRFHKACDPYIEWSKHDRRDNTGHDAWFERTALPHIARKVARRLSTMENRGANDESEYGGSATGTGRGTESESGAGIGTVGARLGAGNSSMAHLVSKLRAGDGDTISWAWEACRFDASTRHWCTLFDEADVEMFAFREDLKSNRGNGRAAAAANVDLACEMMQELLDTMNPRDTQKGEGNGVGKKPKKNKKTTTPETTETTETTKKSKKKKKKKHKSPPLGRFRFTHREIVMPLVAALGLFNDRGLTAADALPLSSAVHIGALTNDLDTASQHLNHSTLDDALHHIPSACGADQGLVGRTIHGPIDGPETCRAVSSQWERMLTRQWRSNVIAPFAANVELELLRCETDGPNDVEWMVAARHNEVPVALRDPNDPSKLCATTAEAHNHIDSPDIVPLCPLPMFKAMHRRWSKCTFADACGASTELLDHLDGA